MLFQCQSLAFDLFATNVSDAEEMALVHTKNVLPGHMLFQRQSPAFDLFATNGADVEEMALVHT